MNAALGNYVNDNPINLGNSVNADTLPTLPALVRPTIGAAISAAVTMLIEPVVSGSSFVQLALAGGAGMIVYILVVVPLDQFRQLKTRVFRARRDGPTAGLNAF